MCWSNRPDGPGTSRNQEFQCLQTTLDKCVAPMNLQLQVYLLLVLMQLPIKFELNWSTFAIQVFSRKSSQIIIILRGTTWCFFNDNLCSKLPIPSLKSAKLQANSEAQSVYGMYVVVLAAMPSK